MCLVMYVIFYQKINNKKYHYFYKSYCFSKIQHTLTYSKFIEQMCKEAVKLGPTPMLSSLAIMENANSESEVLGLGLSVIALNLGMYIALPAIVVVGIRKKF